MSLNLKNFPHSYDEFILNYIPKPLKKEKLYESLLRSRSKKEVEMEIKALTLSQIHSYTYLLKSVENRFWVYGKVLPYKGQSYTLCFKSFDMMLFNYRKNKLISLNSLTYAYNSRKHILRTRKAPTIIKSRLLVLTNKGFKLNFYGLRVLLKPFVFNLKKYKTEKKRKKVNYRSWLILNLNLIGFLSSFRMPAWNLQFLKFNKKKRFYSRKWDHYYQVKSGFKSQIYFNKN